MNVIETHLKGCFVIEPQIFEDERGYFFESFNQQKFNDKIEKDDKGIQYLLKTYNGIFIQHSVRCKFYLIWIRSFAR